MSPFAYTLLIPVIPFVMFLFLGLAGHRLRPSVAGWLGTTGLLSATILSYFAAIQYFLIQGPVDGKFPVVVPHQYTWLQFTDTLSIQMGVWIDTISVMMLVVITTISLMVHLYSTGYMKGERGYTRFYAFLSLFTFSMLGLVLSSNIFQMYIFWELVGVSSFLLIGFYYDKPSAVAASKKAFIVTRFADFGFLVGILLLGFYTQTFSFAELCNPQSAPLSSMAGTAFMGLSIAGWAMLLIFMGGAGKSAMFPLHIWLPDAMEGPTPVSALIHAATMVVAGVYLVARMFVVYYFFAPEILTLIAWVGAFTSLFAAVIATTQTDIKRVLAFSTLSQIGYMMLSLGVSGYGAEEGLGYTASMFHLFTHAMFKALLFLGAGSVIHAVHTNLMTEMGGLRKHLPITHLTFLIACLTISGMPFLSGFFSKDEILVATLQHQPVLFGIAFLVAGLTAFYMFRLYFSIFWGESRTYHHTPHESPWNMAFPLVFLAAASVLVGYLPFTQWIGADYTPFESHFHASVAIPSVVIALVGIALAWRMYKVPGTLPNLFSMKWGRIYTWAYHKFYVDEVYLFVTRTLLFKGISRPVAWFDRNVVDASMNGVGYVVETVSYRIKGLQSGRLQQYAAVFVGSALALLLMALYLL